MLKQFTLNRTSYPLEHLRGFRLVVPQRDPLLAPATLQVTFSCHVFSERWDSAKHTVERRFEMDGDERAFCPVRYGCSISLEKHIRYFANGKAYWGRDGNGIRNSFFYAEANGVPYPIFFRLSRATKINGVDGIMRIISAYQNTNLSPKHRHQSVKFARLVHQNCPPAAES